MDHTVTATVWPGQDEAATGSVVRPEIPSSGASPGSSLVSSSVWEFTVLPPDLHQGADSAVVLDVFQAIVRPYTLGFAVHSQKPLLAEAGHERVPDQPTIVSDLLDLYIDSHC
jgi:hypothetical protein